MNLGVLLSLLVAILRALPALNALADKVEDARRVREAAEDKKVKDARNAAAIEAAKEDSP